MRRLKYATIGSTDFNRTISHLLIVNGRINCEKVIGSSRIGDDTIIRYVRGTIGVFQWLPSILFLVAVVFPNHVAVAFARENRCIITMSVFLGLTGATGMIGIKS